MPEHVSSFQPIVGIQPEILILGTMPGVVSLRAEEYYANPNNAFWRILSTIQGVECPTDYKEKVRLVLEMHLALWDVCHTCIRPGSADSDIRDEEPNRIKELLAAHPSIHTIVFNGQTAEKLFRRHLKAIDGVNNISMPSTSPAHTLSFEKKLDAWRKIIPASGSIFPDK